MATSSSPITIAPALPADYPAIARLEVDTFWDDDFSRVAFGALRGSDEAISRRVESYKETPKNPKERAKHVKAVRSLAGGEEEIVGFAAWTFVRGKAEEGEEKKKKKQGGGEAGDGDKSRWGASANVEFCETFFLSADESMRRSVDGDEYASKLYSSLQHTVT